MNSKYATYFSTKHLAHVHMLFVLLSCLALHNSSSGQYTITACQTHSDALLGIDRNDWAHNNLAIVDEGYLHNFDPIDLPCGLESASLTAVDITITLESNTGSMACQNIPFFGNVLLNCPLTTNSICPIVQDVLSPGCAFGAGQTTMGTFSLNLNGCGVNPVLTDVIGVDIIPATELLGTCVNANDVISSGNVILEYSICVTYTFDQDLPPVCDNSIAVSCNDGDPCTENDTEFVSFCDNSVVCIPCQGVPVSVCDDTISLPCDDGDSCTQNDLEIVAACDNTIVCIPCSGEVIDACEVVEFLPCDDNDPCTINDVQSVSACDNSIVCVPCTGEALNTCDVVLTLPCDDGDPCTINDVQSVSDCDNSIVCEPCTGEVLADCDNTIELACDDGDPCTTSDISIVSACDETIVCVPCQGIIAETCTNTLELPCDDGDDCTNNDIELVDACDNTIVCVPCQGTPIQPQLCDDGDCINGTEEWDENSCSCITTPNILGCTDEASCNYNPLANCNFDCDYSCADCLGEPFGEAIVDECGECVLPDDPLRNIGCLDQLYVPNAFTPDGDGINDFFYAQAGRPPIYFELSIYNRFGEVIFYSDNIAFKWTGDVKGGNHYGQSQLYVYKIQYSFEIGTVVQKTGTVSLVR